MVLAGEGATDYCPFFRSAFFWVVIQRVVVRIQEYIWMGPIGCPETSVRHNLYSLRNDPEEGSSQLLRSGSVTLGLYFVVGMLGGIGPGLWLMSVEVWSV